MVKSLLRKPTTALINRMAGKKKYQYVFTWLYNLAIKGFNLRNADIESNGELNHLYNLRRFYSAINEKCLTIFDVGANKGDFSVAILRVFDGPLRVYAFEPLRTAFQKLTVNAVSIGEKTVLPQNFGLGSKSGRVQFYADSDSSELASMYERDFSEVNIDIRAVEEVEVRELDGFCAEQAISHIHFLKLDVEGAEVEVLKGAKEMLRGTRVDFIQLEFGAGNYHSKTYLRDFFDLLGENYVMARLLKDGLYVMRRYHSDYEILAYGNYIAVSKKCVAEHPDTVQAVFGV